MTFNVLVAEPDNGDWELISNGLARHRPDANILRVKDGEQAVRFLFHRGLFTDEPETPDVVLLAAGLPIIACDAVVARVRQHPRTHRLPVIVVWRAGKNSDAAFMLQSQEWLKRQPPLLTIEAEHLEFEVAAAVDRLCGKPPSAEQPSNAASSLRFSTR